MKVNWMLLDVSESELDVGDVGESDLDVGSICQLRPLPHRLPTVTIV